jgi:aminoglycoside 6'-N-acetyltransferase I
MRQQLWPEEGRDDIADMTRMHVPFVVFVADDGNGLAGFAEATIRSVVDGLYFAPAAFLEGIWVDPSRRREGVAAALLHAVIGWGRDNGVAGLGSDVLLENAVSIAWHKRMGFAVESEVVKFTRTLD